MKVHSVAGFGKYIQQLLFLQGNSQNVLHSFPSFQILMIQFFPPNLHCEGLLSIINFVSFLLN